MNEILVTFTLQITYLRSYYLYERLSLGSESLERCLALYFEAHLEEFEAEEIEALRALVIEYATLQVYAEYAEFNENMLLEMLEHCNPELHIEKYTITRDRISQLNLANDPKNWYK